MNVLNNIPISDWTTFKIGGQAQYFFQPNNLKQIYEALNFIQGHQMKFFVLGEGSNVLVGSQPFEGAVLSLLKLQSIQETASGLWFDAGWSNTEVARWGYEHGYRDFDFLYQMPGTLGGSTVMNARCFGLSMSDIVQSVRAIDIQGQLRTYHRQDIGFGYKKSLFSLGHHIITQVLLKKQRGSKDLILEKMTTHAKHREDSKQKTYPSAGCIFKNNRAFKLPTGKIIDKLGLKGVQLGDAQVYSEHGNFIINTKQAHSSDVFKLIKKIQKAAWNAYGFALECEVRFHGHF